MSPLELLFNSLFTTLILLSALSSFDMYFSIRHPDWFTNWPQP